MGLLQARDEQHWQYLTPKRAGGPPDRRKVTAVPHPPGCGVGSVSPIPTPPEGSPAPFVAPEESTLGDKKLRKGAKEPTKPLF